MPSTDSTSPAARRQRWRLLAEMDRAWGPVLDLLGLAWLLLLVTEFVWGEGRWTTTATQTIWVIFILDAVAGLILAPDKTAFVRRNWLTLLALLVPALRIFRIARVLPMLRAARAVRGLRLVRVLTSINRGMRTLRRTAARKGLGYVLGLTFIVTIVGAAGMFAFERPPDGGLETYGDALWWTAMMMTTMGSEYWPKSLEGRTLALLLAAYAFAIFGYVTAAIASLLVENSMDRARDKAAPPK
jgi:voltage-gated potassium channel